MHKKLADMIRISGVFLLAGWVVITPSLAEPTPSSAGEKSNELKQALTEALLSELVDEIDDAAQAVKSELLANIEEAKALAISRGQAVSEQDVSLVKQNAQQILESIVLEAKENYRPRGNTAELSPELFVGSTKDAGAAEDSHGSRAVADGQVAGAHSKVAPPETTDLNQVSTGLHVKSRLLASDDVQGLGIDVDSEHGDITLQGGVTSRRQKRLAAIIAANVMGVETVKNELNVYAESTALSANTVGQDIIGTFAIVGFIGIVCFAVLVLWMRQRKFARDNKVEDKRLRDKSLEVNS